MRSPEVGVLRAFAVKFSVDNRRYIEGIDALNWRIKLGLRWSVEPSGSVAIGSKGGTPSSSELVREFGLSETVARSLAAADAPKKLRGDPDWETGREKGPSGSESPHAGDAEPIRRRRLRAISTRGSPSSASE
jgi:hypothetical protein